MFRIDTNKTWSGRYYPGDIVRVIVLSYGKEFQKNSNLLEKNGFPLKYINRQIQHFLAKKQSEKPITDEKDDTKRIFTKIPCIKEMNGHIPKESNVF